MCSCKKDGANDLYAIYFVLQTHIQAFTSENNKKTTYSLGITMRYE